MQSRALKRKREMRSGVVRSVFMRLDPILISKDLQNLRQYLQNFNLACTFFEIPDELENCVAYNLPQELKVANLKFSFPCIFDELAPKNYVTRMETLVFLEEISQRDQNHYEAEESYAFVYYDEWDDLYHVTDYPVLEQRHPKIIIGGKILLSDCRQGYSNWSSYDVEGTIVEVFNDGFAFDSAYDIDDGVFGIEFLHSRTNIRKQLFSIGKVIQNLGFSFLFPVTKQLKMSQIRDNAEIRWFYNNLNGSQKDGVRRILNGNCRPMPYIIFGPPGTGKTITLVESVCQIITIVNKSVVLVATPSNSGADKITRMLSEFLSIRQFCRIVSVNYFERDLLPEDIIPFSMSIKDVSEETIRGYKVIIGTCSTIASLHFHDLASNHFTHVLIDEAGRCTEPEIMCPISLMHENGQVVLFGDPMQLGPTVLSPLCKSSRWNDRLERSFLERLMELPVYLENGNTFDPFVVTRLIVNYR